MKIHDWNNKMVSLAFIFMSPIIRCTTFDLISLELSLNCLLIHIPELFCKFALTIQAKCAMLLLRFY